MRIYTPAGDLAFKAFDFPDSAPHFKLETYDVDFRSVTIELAIRGSRDLLMLCLVNDVLRAHGYSEVSCDVRYLLGARMDRAISTMEPFSLAVIARIINSCGFTKVRILDVHSEVATRLIRNSENVLPFGVVEQVQRTLNYPVVVSPDKGARDRVRKLYPGIILECSKTRDVTTGELKGFKIDGPWQNFRDGRGGHEALIIDDLCDGGGTFIGLSKILREAGAKKVFLFVTHAVMSKGLKLEGIDHIYTTDSYYDQVRRNGELDQDRLTVIPISMKEIK